MISLRRTQHCWMIWKDQTLNCLVSNTELTEQVPWSELRAPIGVRLVLFFFSSHLSPPQSINELWEYSVKGRCWLVFRKSALGQLDHRKDLISDSLYVWMKGRKPTPAGLIFLNRKLLVILLVLFKAWLWRARLGRRTVSVAERLSEKYLAEKRSSRQTVKSLSRGHYQST